MKKVLVAFPLFFSFLFGEAQATTEVEYNYMKKGYRISVETGLDVKSGYYIDEQKPFVRGNVTITATRLYRTDKTLAGTIIKTVSTDFGGSGTNYYAIPAVNLVGKESYGWDLYAEDLNNLSCGMRYYLLQWMSYKLAYETTN